MTEQENIDPLTGIPFDEQVERGRLRQLFTTDELPDEKLRDKFVAFVQRWAERSNKPVKVVPEIFGVYWDERPPISSDDSDFRRDYYFYHGELDEQNPENLSAEPFSLTVSALFTTRDFFNPKINNVSEETQLTVIRWGEGWHMDTKHAGSESLLIRPKSNDLRFSRSNFIVGYSLELQYTDNPGKSKCGIYRITFVKEKDEEVLDRWWEASWTKDMPRTMHDVSMKDLLLSGKQKVQRGQIIYDAHVDGGGEGAPIIVIRRYPDSGPQDVFIIPLDVSPKDIIDKLFNPITVADPFNAPPELDDSWRLANLMEVVGIRWERF